MKLTNVSFCASVFLILALPARICVVARKEYVTQIIDCCYAIVINSASRNAKAPSVQWLDCCCAHIFQTSTTFEMFIRFSQCACVMRGKAMMCSAALTVFSGPPRCLTITLMVPE